MADIDSIEFARAAARRFLAREHRILLRTLVRDDVARAVFEEAAACGIEDPADVDLTLVQAAVDQVAAVRVEYGWFGEEPICGAEPETLLAQMGCKPCSLPAGHDGHQYPYPIPARSSETEENE